MERIHSINPDRIRWCCDDRGITTEELASVVVVAPSKLERVMAGEDGLTFKQLRNIATYFNRGTLFFLETSPVNERQVRSPEFRTIANQKPDLSPEVKAIVERVELHREIYLGLREDLDEEDAPEFNPPDLPRNNPMLAAAIARNWLGLESQNNFDLCREAVEAKGILVFRSMGYQGAWRIPAESLIVGFSLYHSVCPVIVIKKQAIETRQTFTLMHELGHILLHRASFIDEDADMYSHEGRERVANAFAGHVLVPDEFLQQINDDWRPESVSAYSARLRAYTQHWGVGTEVILRRLLDAGRLDQSQYDAYREWRGRQPLPQQKGGSRKYRAREPLHIFGGRFVRTVLDALYARQITMNKASAFLDNLKIKDVHALEAHLADL